MSGMALATGWLNSDRRLAPCRSQGEEGLRMRREDVWGILGGLLLLGMAWLDAGWRWFWAAAGVGMLLWSIYTAICHE